MRRCLLVLLLTAGALAPPASARPALDGGAARRAPSATVGAASAVTNTTATIGGSVTTDGSPATVHFVITPQGGTAFNTPDQTGVTDGPVSADLSGLTPNTQYTFSVVVQSGGTNAQSGTAAFTTKPDAPTAAAGAATAITATTATLTGTVDLKQATTGTAAFVYGPSTTPDQATTGGTVSADLTGLAPNTTYSWKLHVQTAGGVADSTVVQFLTLPAAPTAQTGDATEISDTSARLAGTADTMGVQGQVSVLLDGTPLGEETRFTGPFSVVATGLAPASTHTYRLRVVTTGGTALGAEKTFTTAAASATPTPTPTASATATATATATDPTLRLSGTRTHAARTLLLTGRTVKLLARCGSVACRVAATGKVSVAAHDLGPFVTPAAPLSLDAGEQAAIAVHSTRAVRRKVNAAGGRPKIALRGRFTADGGTADTPTLTITSGPLPSVRVSGGALTVTCGAVACTVKLTAKLGHARAALPAFSLTAKGKEKVELNKLLGGLSHGTERQAHVPVKAVFAGTDGITVAHRIKVRFHWD